MSLSINVQELKKYNYVSYSISNYGEDGWEDEEFEEYNPEVWDIEGWKNIFKDDYIWSFLTQSHSIEGRLLEISIFEGLFIMNIDGNLVRIPVNTFDESNNHNYFLYHGGDYCLSLSFYNKD